MASPVTGNSSRAPGWNGQESDLRPSSKGRNVLKTSTEHTLNPALDRITVRFWSPGSWRTQKAIFLMFAVLRSVPYALASDNGKVTGRLEGTVFVGDEG